MNTKPMEVCPGVQEPIRNLRWSDSKKYPDIAVGNCTVCGFEYAAMEWIDHGFYPGQHAMRSSKHSHVCPACKVVWLCDMLGCLYPDYSNCEMEAS